MAKDRSSSNLYNNRHASEDLERIRRHVVLPSHHPPQGRRDGKGRRDATFPHRHIIDRLKLPQEKSWVKHLFRQRTPTCHCFKGKRSPPINATKRSHHFFEKREREQLGNGVFVTGYPGSMKRLLSFVGYFFRLSRGFLMSAGRRFGCLCVSVARTRDFQKMTYFIAI